MSSLSTMYIKSEVRGYRNGAAVDPSADVVQMAFVTSGQPAGGDWRTGSWESFTLDGIVRHVARVLVGPTGGAVTLARGTYRVWLKVTDSSEVPAEDIGQLVIY